MAFRIFAHHAHLLPESVNPNGTPDRLIRLMDECGIERAVAFAPFAHQVEKLGIDRNAWLADQIKSRPRLCGFGTLDLRRPDVDVQVRRIVELGFKGIKLHPNAQEFDILAPAALEAYAAAQACGLFVTIHSGVHYYRLKHYSVLKFDEIAQQFPKLRFSMEHMGGYSFFNEALAVLVNNFPPPWVTNKKCMVFAGLASVFTPNHNRFWYLRPDQLMEIARQSSVDQLIFGLDFPYNLEAETKLAIKAIGELPLSEEEKAKVLGGNLERELGT